MTLEILGYIGIFLLLVLVVSGTPEPDLSNDAWEGDDEGD